MIYSFIQYTERLLNIDETFMRQARFYSAFTCVLISAGFLSFRVGSLLLAEPSLRSTFFCYCFSLLNTFVCFGIGIGLPLVLIASILAWAQLALLLKGNINPHLAREGLINTLGILISKL